MLPGRRPAARLAARLAVTVSRSTLLRILRDLPAPSVDSVPEIGIDDFAVRRGRVYGTVIIDMRTHRPIDVLPDRTSDTVTEWLQAHPGIQIRASVAVYYPCLEATAGRPYGLRVHGNDDVTGALPAFRSIVTWLA